MPEITERFVVIRKTQKEKEELWKQLQVVIAQRLAERDTPGEPIDIDF
ncbi:MAG: hypothetical protein QNJ74_15070 [Trichodesmium sp. MO_231.B1]|nr:hypothetical protein [Trichodesmium sp. MO_231.B1]